MLLNGFGFSSYRSFGDELTKIAPLKKINLIIGQNNVGKSNIIKFLSEQYSHFLFNARHKPNSRPENRHKHSFSDIDRNQLNKNLTHKIAFPLFESEIDNFINRILPDQTNKPNGSNIRALAKRILKSESFFDGSAAWFVYESNSYNGDFQLNIKPETIKNVLNEGEWYSLWARLANQSQGDLMKHWIPMTLQHLTYLPTSTPGIVVIPAIRKIGPANTEANDYSGLGIINRLAKIQNPSHTEQILKKKFDAINSFVQEVMENDSARIEVPYERNMILVHMDGKTLPIESLGTGVHEVVILATAATLLEKTILCVEEPELHLHPLLQRKLLKYLCDKTENQYIFTTHSAHLLDAVDSEIFHVTMENGFSKADSISSTRQKSNICNDLGYKASDILQANCVIWVEGPSDRLYLNYWLSSIDPNLTEGIHYSIMFFGGRLFSHLTALDSDELNENIEEFISLKSLNRKSIIVFDSDKKSSKDLINETKIRLQSEFESGDGFAWVTDGREIENYLDHDKIETSVIAVHPSAEHLQAKGKWKNLLSYVSKKDGKIVTANKVKVAKHYISNNPVDLNKLDLNEMIHKVYKFILDANGTNILSGG